MSDLPSRAVLESALPSETPQVLLVEDDVELCEAISQYLARNGFKVHAVHRGDAAMRHIEADNPSLVILDIMLPGKDGYELCKAIRSSGSHVPILMLTAKDEEIDEVLGLELGADDYLPKPVKPRLLLARIRALVRRRSLAQDAEPAEVLSFGRLQIDCGRMEVNFAGRNVGMTPAEFDLLRILAMNVGKVMHRGELLLALRGLHSLSADRSMDARLYRMRRRFGDDEFVNQRIKTVRPHGYLFVKGDW